MMSDTEGEMMRGPFGHPTLEERSHIGSEKASRVGIAGGWNGAAYALPFGHHELKPSVVGDIDTQHGDRPFFDFEFDARSGAGLAVEFDQAAQHRLLLGDIDVVGPVMAHQYKSLCEVDRVELR